MSYLEKLKKNIVNWQESFNFTPASNTEQSERGIQQQQQQKTIVWKFVDSALRVVP